MSDAGQSEGKIFIGNVRHYDSVLPAMKGVDYVFHAAAEYNSHNTRRMDVEGMCELLMKLQIVRDVVEKKN